MSLDPQNQEEIPLLEGSDAGEATTPPPEPVPPIESRFLFVDVAAMRAKQLRRGARPRLQGPSAEPSTGGPADLHHKLERLAMEEVRQGLIQYMLPESKPAGKEAA